MIGEIVQGADFRGVVNYVMLKPDAEPLGSRGLRDIKASVSIRSCKLKAESFLLINCHIWIDYLILAIITIILYHIREGMAMSTRLCNDTDFLMTQVL